MPRGSRRKQRACEAMQALRESDGVIARPGGERVEGEWTVRSVGPSDRPYRCPGCDHEVVGVPHVVAWRDSPDDRRHWHTPCWSARDRRHPR